MPQVFDKVLSNVNICAIEIAFTGDAQASTITGWQPFYNQTFIEADFQKAYASISSIEFSEESVEKNGNISFKQQAQFRFPSNDKYRAERIALLHTIKFLKLKLNDGTVIVIGRNDIFQNALPSIKSKSNHQTCEITIETMSIAPAGFTPNFDRFGLPVFIPLSF